MTLEKFAIDPLRRYTIRTDYGLARYFCRPVRFGKLHFCAVVCLWFAWAFVSEIKENTCAEVNMAAWKFGQLRDYSILREAQFPVIYLE